MSWRHRSAFSPGADLLAHAGVDGRLRIWDTASGRLKQEYTPSGHLATSYSCVAWVSPSDRRRGEQLILGGVNGTLSLYRLSHGDVKLVTARGHARVVACLSWSQEHKCVYSGGNDCHLLRWDLKSQDVKTRWKAGKETISAVLCVPGGPWLLSASRGITLWDTDKQEAIRNYVGHANPVAQLGWAKGFCLSVAAGERVVNAWEVAIAGDKKGKKTAHTSFTLTDEPTFMHTQASGTSGDIWMAVVTRIGALQVFDHQITGPSKKPVKPSANIHIVMDTTGTSEPARPIPVQAITSDGEGKARTVHVVYGNYLHPIFEKLKSRSLADNTCLIRKPAFSESVGDTRVSKVKATDVSKGAAHLAPGYMSSGLGPTGRGKRKMTSSSCDIPMESRSELAKGAMGGSVGQEGMAQLLVQGLRSQDVELIRTVFKMDSEQTIVQTLQRVPIQAILPLLTRLKSVVEEGSKAGVIHLKWLRYLLQIHSSYLATCPEAEDLLCSLWSILEARTSTFVDLTLLKGILEFTSSQPIYEGEPEEFQPLHTFKAPSDDEVDMESLDKGYAMPDSDKSDSDDDDASDSEGDDDEVEEGSENSNESNKEEQESENSEEDDSSSSDEEG